MSAIEPTEGVIKFTSDHRSTTLATDRFAELCAELTGWRTILFTLGLVGRDAGRYDGAAFGNVSGRSGPFPGSRGARPFLVSGSQTSGQAQVTLVDYCLVTACDGRANRVTSQGPLLPSSESMTHAAIYDLNPAIRFVFHIHSPEIWQKRAALRLPTTHPQVAYGTVEMAQEMARLYRDSTLSETRVLAMAGHEDGILSFGRQAEETGLALIAVLARARRS